MSLITTLGKLAVGMLVAKGVGKILGGNKAGGGGGGGGGLGGLLGGSDGGGGLGGLLGGGGQKGGGLGGLLDSLGAASRGEQSQQGGGGGLGDLLNAALNGQQPQKAEPSAEQQAEQQAEVLLRAMLSAAKADGQIDKAEQEKIGKQLDDISEEEADFVRKEMASPMDMKSFVRTVPSGMEQQVYLMSLLAIDLDSKAEAQYLDQLAKALKISPDVSNQIHKKLGAPALYS